MAIRQPRSTAQAQELAERFAALEGELEIIEAARSDAIAAANAQADTASSALLEERQRIRAVMEPWWAKARPGLTDGKRKSIELGGCMIGSRSGSRSLKVADENAAVAKLREKDWGKDLVRTRHSLDRRAIMSAMAGEHKAKLRRLGFTIDDGSESFILERVAQSGTLGSAQS